MLFDLEIQPNLIDIVYIKQGNKIHNSLVPVSYMNVHERNVIPADLIEIEEDARFTTFASSVINVVQSGQNTTEFPVASDKFIMTHVKKYSNETGTDIPLFYKHIIDIKTPSQVPEDSIRIYDSTGILIGSDQFISEYFADHIDVYMNPKNDAILTIEYTLEDGIKSELVKLEPIFTQVEWDFILTKEDLREFEYMYFDSTVYTKYSGVRYYIYQRNLSIFNKPIAGMNESWYLRIENVSFTENMNGAFVDYFMPEYNIQQMGYGVTKKLHSGIQAKIIGNKYVQLQDVILKENLPYVNIYIKNLQSEQIEYIFTANPSVINTFDSTTGLRWMSIDDWNTNGIFELPITLTEDHIAISDFYTPNKFYELRTLDLNSMDINSSKIIGVYILPATNIDNMAAAIFWAYIGVFDSNNSYDKIGVNGSGFNDKDDYLNALKDSESLHLAYVSLSTNKMVNITEFNDAREFNGGIINKNDLSKNDYDIFIDDYIKGEVVLPIGDALVATIDDSVFVKPRNSKDNIAFLNDKNDKYKAFVKEILYKNLDISTEVIVNN